MSLEKVREEAREAFWRAHESALWAPGDAVEHCLNAALDAYHEGLIKLAKAKADAPSSESPLGEAFAWACVVNRLRTLKDTP